MNKTDLRNALLKSVIDQDRAPVVICSLDSVIQYMNPAAIAYYRRDLTGSDLAACHSPKSNEKIRQVLDWFAKSKTHNSIYTYHDDKENKDIYMIALRDEEENLIGYYEKHEYRSRETAAFYAF